MTLAVWNSATRMHTIDRLCLCVCVFVCLFVCLFVYLFVCYVCPSPLPPPSPGARCLTSSGSKSSAGVVDQLASASTKNWKDPFRRP